MKLKKTGMNSKKQNKTKNSQKAKWNIQDLAGHKRGIQ
jgi:hypothetical protein